MSKQKWNEIFRDKRFHFEEPEKSFVVFVERYVKDKNRKLLDIGCGRGRNSIYAARKGIDVWAIDISDEAIEYLERYAEKENIGNLHVKKADMKELPFEDESFDIIVNVNNANHGTYKEVENCFLEAFRVLKHGGYFFMHACTEEMEKYVLTKDSVELEPHTFVGLNTFDGDIVHHWFTKEDIQNLFKEFQILKNRIVTEKIPWLDKEVEQLVLVAQKR